MKTLKLGNVMRIIQVGEFNHEYEVARRSLIDADKRRKLAEREYQEALASFTARYPNAVIPNAE